MTFVAVVNLCALIGGWWTVVSLFYAWYIGNWGACDLPSCVGLENIPSKYCYETDELPNPRPAQPSGKNRLKSGVGPLFFFSPCEQVILSWVGIVFV